MAPPRGERSSSSTPNYGNAEVYHLADYSDGDTVHNTEDLLSGEQHSGRAGYTKHRFIDLQSFGPCYESHSKVRDAASGAGNSCSIFGKQSRACSKQSEVFFAPTLSGTPSQKGFCPCKQPAWPTHQVQAAAGIVEAATKREGSSLWRSRPTLAATAAARATEASSTKARKPRDPRSPTTDNPRGPEDAQRRPGLARDARREHPLWGKASPTDRGRIDSSTDSSRSIQLDYLQLLWGGARTNYGTGDRHSKGTLGLQGHLRWHNAVHALQGWRCWQSKPVARLGNTHPRGRQRHNLS